MPPVGFEPTISAGEWPQTYALDLAATGTGFRQCKVNEILAAQGCKAVGFGGHSVLRYNTNVWCVDDGSPFGRPSAVPVKLLNGVWWMRSGVENV